MPFDQYRTVVAALDRLTTQVGRVADAMVTPVVEEDDAPQTGFDDTRHNRYATAIRGQWRGLTDGDAIYDIACAVTSLADQEQAEVRTELARIRRALDPDDEMYIRETVDDQLALHARVQEQQAAIERVRAVRKSPPRSESNARTNAQDEGWDQAIDAVHAALGTSED